MIEVLVQSFLIGLSGALSPGPLSASILGMSHKKPLVSTAGLVAGHGIVELLVVFGISLGLRSLPFRTELALLGCAVLVLFGILQFRAGQGEGIHGGDGRNPFLAGAILTLSNPYWWIWWLTFGAGFLALTPAYPEFFTGHIAADALWFGILAMASSRGAEILGEKYRWVVKGSGAAMAAFGILFALSIFSA
ncbi:MAG: LysE family translocator [Methanomicrobiales archaeon]|nr:LysE family translocator [Methanomicrobiales archaeon]